jgi:CII-binding regulator of phage lambda lysogenization HflD
MVRATLEQILHDVYGLSTTDLKEAIKKLPEYTSPHLVAKAQRIRTVAVWLLHAEQKAHKNKTELETLQEKKILNEALSNLEREVASALLVLRDLVEGARDDAMLVIQEVKSEDNGTYSERT